MASISGEVLFHMWKILKMITGEEILHIVIKFDGEDSDTNSSNDGGSSISGWEADDDASVALSGTK
jgi:hypothetical protein